MQLLSVVRCFSSSKSFSRDDLPAGFVVFLFSKIEFALVRPGALVEDRADFSLRLGTLRSQQSVVVVEKIAKEVVYEKLRVNAIFGAYVGYCPLPLHHLQPPSLDLLNQNDHQQGLPVCLLFGCLWTKKEEGQADLCFA